MQKVVLRINIEVQREMEIPEIPEERPGGGSSESYRVMAHAVPAILRGVGMATPFGGNPALLTLSRQVSLDLSGDLKELAEIAARFDQLATQIEADRIGGRTL